MPFFLMLAGLLKPQGNRVLENVALSPSAKLSPPGRTPKHLNPYLPGWHWGPIHYYQPEV